MVRKQNCLDSDFEKAIKRIIRELKIWPGHNHTLRNSLSTPQDKKRLITYANKSKILFSNLPSFIKEMLTDYYWRIQQRIGNEINKRIENADFYSRIAIRKKNIRRVSAFHFSPLTFLESPTYKKSVSKYLSKIAALRFCVNNIDNKATTSYLDASKNKLWTLPFAYIKDLLEFLGEDNNARIAIVDGYEPINDFQKICRLAGYLSLYNYHPILTTQGALLSPKNKLKKTLRILSDSGIAGIHLYIDASKVKTIEFDAVSMLCREINKLLLNLRIYYIFDNNKKSRLWLQRLLADLDFNNLMSSFVYVRSRDDKNNRSVSQALCNEIASELIVDSSGLLKLYKRGFPNFKQCSLSDNNWKKIFSSWFLNSKESYNA